MRTVLLPVCSLILIAASEACARDAKPCQVQVVLFVPADVQAPTRYQHRVDEIVAYAESFFKREFKRWDIKQFVSPFCRSADGHVEVTVVHGKQAAATYKPVTVRGEVMDLNREQDKITNALQVWWILVYAGDPPAKFNGYLGGFGEQIGGWAVCNFNTTPGRIKPAEPLGSDFLEGLTLKGMIHELGHGFQLPHIGPLKRDNAGNTLMGPTHIHFRRVAPASEDRVYLSQAEATLLSNHSAFRGERDERKPLPKVDVQNLKYAVDRRKRAFVVTGRVLGADRPVYALVGDESDARPGEYWTKTYVGKVSTEGTFEVIVTEPAESGGTLKTWFAFAGGAQTGDGKSRGRGSGIAKPYTFSRGQWTLK
jgi:hypothetical protein